MDTHKVRALRFEVPPQLAGDRYARRIVAEYVDDTEEEFANTATEIGRLLQVVQDVPNDMLPLRLVAEQPLPPPEEDPKAIQDTVEESLIASEAPAGAPEGNTEPEGENEAEEAPQPAF